MGGATTRSSGGGTGPCTFGAAGRSLSGWFHAPAGPPRGAGVVICNPIGDDAVRAHRPLRHLAERLARRGLAALRFDFHGTGDSPGDERDPGLVAAWLADVGLAADEVRARSGAAAIAVVGLRFGATLAAIAAASIGVDSLVMWGPHVSGEAFATGSIRNQKMLRLLEPRSFAGGPRSRDDGEEALGFLFTHEALADLRALDVRGLSARPAPRALLLSDGSAAAADREIEGHLRSLDVDVERRVLAGCQQFLVEIPHKSRLPGDALDVVVAWLDARCPIDAGAPAPPERAPADHALQAGAAREEAVVFGRRSLLGILHAPSREAAAGRAPIALVSAGTVHRIGPHRFYVKLARRLSALGFPVLRVDLSGIGDSPAGDDGVENVTYPRGGYEDLDDALTLLAGRFGAPRLVVAGLCSGGDFAFQMGARDPRVGGVVILNPRTFCVNDLAAVETGNLASVLAAAAHFAGEPTPVPASLRRMVERGVDTLLVVTEADPGVRYVDERWGDAMRALADLPGFTREDVAGTDHNFTSLWAQDRVADLVTEHVARRFSP